MARASVDPASADMRLDRFVAKIVSSAGADVTGAEMSVHAARRLIAEGRVRVDGRRVEAGKKGLHLAPGQTVEIEEQIPATTDPAARAGAPVAEPGLPLTVLYCDADLVAVDKPAGMASHPLRAGETGTLANALVARFPECAAAGGDPREGGLGHRLDRETSGVLIAARSHPAWLALRAALKAPACEKSYLAEVTGRPEPQGRLVAPIGRSGRRGRRVRVGDGRNPLDAATAWEVLEPRGPATLIRARLHAGRAHQVRAHLASIGHAIVGDQLYGDAPTAATAPAAPGEGLTTLRLHAESVRLRHPTSPAPAGETLFIQAPPPEWAKMTGG